MMPVGTNGETTTAETKPCGTSILPYVSTLSLVIVSSGEPWLYMSHPGTWVGKPWALLARTPEPSSIASCAPWGLYRPGYLPVLLLGRVQPCGSSPSLGAPVTPPSPPPEKPLLWDMLLPGTVTCVPCPSSCRVLPSAPSSRNNEFRE